MKHLVCWLYNLYSFFPGVNIARLRAPKYLLFQYGLENDGSDGHYMVGKRCLKKEMRHTWIEASPEKQECAHCGCDWYFQTGD